MSLPHRPSRRQTFRVCIAAVDEEVAAHGLLPRAAQLLRWVCRAALVACLLQYERPRTHIELELLAQRTREEVRRWRVERWRQ
jgi:hypothetical protein